MIKDLLTMPRELQLSHKSKNLLNNLQTELHNASLLKPQVSVVNNVSFNQLSPLIPASIQVWIKANPMILRSYTLLVGGRTYNLHFYTSTRCSLTSHIQKINTWLTVASKYAEAHCSKQVDVYLYLTPIKKVLPKSKKQDISEEHANTAFTTSCAPKTEIVLFREEEWFKVFIHESFHNLGLDFSETYGQTKGRHLLKSMFNIKSDFRLFEVYCEMWAELICVLMQSMQYEKVRDVIQVERKFSMFQAAKILDFYGLNYEDLFYNSSYNESTEVFCYYILKSLLMYNLNAFLEWVVDEQGGSLQFNKTKVEKFIKKLIVPYYKQREYINCMEQTQTYFDVPRSKAIDKTMRMTAQC
jgi:hypothetical protein